VELSGRAMTARLSQDNRQLREQLELAAAVIQRITLES
jgi:hypothetical protein